uniref:Jumonji domain containing 7 n=1 Tax=Cyprinus carpio TaxID=7962 RepID=A0A8C1TV65_CYPCA
VCTSPVSSSNSSVKFDRELKWYLDGPLSPFQFYRDWIGPNKPCIIHNAFSDWPALSRHSNNTRCFVTLQIFFMLKQQHYRLTKVKKKKKSEKHYFSVVHKNHYGNLYCVISGQKEFILLLPMDRPFIPYGKEQFLYPAVSFVLLTDEEDTTKVMLYLPSLWFQHVQQPHGCIAVNFWYNMECDIKYNYFQLVESLTNAAEMCPLAN